jgi:hypothetical protein
MDTLVVSQNREEDKRNKLNAYVHLYRFNENRIARVEDTKALESNKKNDRCACIHLYT